MTPDGASAPGVENILAAVAYFALAFSCLASFFSFGVFSGCFLSFFF